MWETWVRSLSREDPLEKELATNSSTLAWKIPWREEPGRLQSMGSQRVSRTGLSDFTFTSRLQRGLNLLISWPWVEEVILDYPGSSPFSVSDWYSEDAAFTKAEFGGRGHQPRKSWKGQENRIFFPIASRRDVALQIRFLAVPSGMWDLSSPTRDQTHVPCSGSAWFLTTGLQGKSSRHFDFNLVRPILDFCFPELKDNKSVLF